MFDYDDRWIPTAFFDISLQQQRRRLCFLPWTRPDTYT